MTNKASDRAKSRNRNGGKFADEVRKPSNHPLGDAVQETGIMSDEDRHALNQTRIREQFAVELSQAATDGYLDVEFTGVRNYVSHGAHRVDGDAELGEVVHYFDIANQHQAHRRVIAKRIPDAKYGARERDFILQDVETGDISASDLRQHGWTLVEEGEIVSQYLDEYGNRYGYCNDCGEEAILDSECCINGEVVPHDDDIDTNL